MSEDVTEIARKLAAEFVQHFGLDFPEDRSDDGTCSTCVAMTEKVLRSYGDTRERAGIERAADLCGDKGSARDWPGVDEASAYGNAACELEALIRALPVPAPNAGGAKKRKAR